MVASNTTANLAEKCKTSVLTEQYVGLVARNGSVL